MVVSGDPQSFSVLFQVGDALLVLCRGQTLATMEKTMMYKFFGKAVPDIVVALVFYVFVVGIIALMENGALESKAQTLMSRVGGQGAREVSVVWHGPDRE